MAGRARLTLKVFIPAGVIVALLLAGVVSYYASAAPDGLVSTAQQLGFIDTEQEHTRSGSTFAGYTTNGVGNDRLSGAIAGVTGVTITLAVSALLFFAVRRRGGRSPDSTSADTAMARTPR